MSVALALMWASYALGVSGLGVGAALAGQWWVDRKVGVRR